MQLEVTTNRIASNGIGAESPRIHAVWYHVDLAGRKPFAFHQKPTVIPSHRDEPVRQRSQATIQPPDPVGPTGGMQRRQNHRHSRPPSGQTPPEHLVARSHRDDSVHLPLDHQSLQTSPYAHVIFRRRQATMHRNFTCHEFAQRPRLLQATDLRAKATRVHPTDQVD